MTIQPARSQLPAHPLLATLVTLYILALFVPQAVYVTFGPLQLTPTRLLALAMFPLLVSGSGKIRWAWPDLFVVAAFGAPFLSYVARGGIAAAVESGGRQFLDGSVAYMVGRAVASNGAWLIRTMRLLIGLLAVLAVFVVLEATAEINVHLTIWGALGNVGTVYDEQRLGFTRARGWTTHPIMLGLVYAMFLPFAIQAAVDRTGMAGRLAPLKAVALGAGAFFSMSSGGWIAALVVVALSAWDRFVRVPAALRWGFFFVMTPLSYIVLEVIANRPLLRILMMRLHISSPDAWAYRWRLNQRVLEQMPGHWPLGWGLELPAAFSFGVSGWSIDNQYLMLLLMTGVIGLSTWIALMLAVLAHRAWQVWGAGDDARSNAARAARFAVLSMAAAQFSVAVFSTAAVVMWLVMGLAISMGQACVPAANPPRAGRQPAPPRNPPRPRAGRGSNLAQSPVRATGTP